MADVLHPISHPHVGSAVPSKKFSLEEYAESRDFLARDTDSPSHGVGEAAQQKRSHIAGAANIGSPVESIFQQPPIHTTILREHFEPSPSKPKLKPPELMMMDMGEKIKKLSKRTMALSLNRIDKENKCLEKLIGQQFETDQDLANSQSQTFIWSILRNIGSCVMAVFNMVFGGFLISTGGGTVAGSALVASGFLALVNTALIETGGWNWIAECLEAENEDNKEMLTIILPLLIAALSIGLGLAGFTEVARAQNVDDITTLVQRGILLLTGVGSVGHAYTENEISKIQIRSTDIEKGMTFSKERIDTASRVFEQLTRGFDHVSSGIKKTVKGSIQKSRELMG